MKRTFEQIRGLILEHLFHGQQTINQLAISTGVNWRSVRQHLAYLSYNGDVAEILHSEYVRIFRLTEQGMQKASNPGLKTAKPIEIEVKSSGAGIERVEIK